MTRLSCSVENCANNQNHQCCLAAIQVEGTRATSSVETICDSYISQKGGQNLTQDPNDVLNVFCKAQQCIYNREGHCGADSIGIAGSGRSLSAHDTECSSFICK